MFLKIAFLIIILFDKFAAMVNNISNLIKLMHSPKINIHNRGSIRLSGV